MSLDVLVAYARDERLVAIGKPEELEGRPQLGILDRRGDVGRRALREEGERRAEELLEAARKGRGQDGEEMRLEVDDVRGRDGVAQPRRAGVAGWKRDDVCVGVLTRHLEPTQSTSPPTKAQVGQLRQGRRWPATVERVDAHKKARRTNDIPHNPPCTS